MSYTRSVPHTRKGVETKISVSWLDKWGITGKTLWTHFERVAQRLKIEE